MQSVLNQASKLPGTALAALLFGTVFLLGLAIFALSQSLVVSAATMALASVASALAARDLFTLGGNSKSQDDLNLELRQQTKRISVLSDRIIELQAELRDIRPERVNFDDPRVDFITKEIDELVSIVSHLISVVDGHETRLAHQPVTKIPKPTPVPTRSQIAPALTIPKSRNPLATLQTEGILRDDIMAGKLTVKLIDIMHLGSERVALRHLQCLIESRLSSFKTDIDLTNQGISPGVIQLYDRVRFGYAFELAGQIAAQSGEIPIVCPIMNATFCHEKAAEEIVSLIESRPENASRLVIALDQTLMDALTAQERARLLRLYHAGVRLAMIVSRDFSFDPQDIAELGFSLALADGDALLADDMTTLRSEIHQSDLASYLDRFGIFLIAQNVADAVQMRRLKSLGIPYAGGAATMRHNPNIQRDRIATMPDGERGLRKTNDVTSPQSAKLEKTAPSSAPLRERLRRVQA